MHEPYAGAAETHSAVVYFAGDRPGRRGRRPARLHGPEQRPDPQGTRRTPAGQRRRGAIRHRDLHPAWTQRCYAELLRRAGSLLANGESVIADASWISPLQRSAAAALAGEVSAELVQVRCTASQDLAEQRISARRYGVSDADADVARHMAADMAPWPEATTVDTESGGVGADAESSGAFCDLVRQLLNAVRPHGPQHAWRPSWPVMLPD